MGCSDLIIFGNLKHNPKAFEIYSKSRLKNGIRMGDLKIKVGDLISNDSAKEYLLNQYLWKI